jgi:hypothetical protein
MIHLEREKLLLLNYKVTGGGFGYWGILLKRRWINPTNPKCYI